MFALAVIEDEVALAASSLRPGKHVQALREVIEEKFIDRVIPAVGLVIALYDFLSVKDAFIFPGDLRDSQGEAACTVVFRLIVFQPTSDQLMIGRIVRSTTAGLHVSLNFFGDVEIPSHALRMPNVIEERTKTWVWQYEEEGKPVRNFFYSVGEEIALRVKAVHQGEDGRNSGAAAQRVQLNRRAAQVKPAGVPSADSTEATPQDRAAPPLLVIGAVDGDGLGPLSWWI